MNLSNPRDVLYAPNGMEQECSCSLSRVFTNHEQQKIMDSDFPPPYTNDFDGGYKPADKLARIESYIDGTLLAIRQYPYQGGIEDLRTTLICTLNAMGEIVSYLRRHNHDAGSRPGSNPRA